MQSHPVVPVAAPIDVFDCAQVHDGMPAELDERITTEPVHEFSQGTVSPKLLEHGMYPGAPFPSQYRDNLVAS